MLSKDGKIVLCDIRGCGRAAVGGCELRIAAGIGGDHSTIPGDLIAWCESDEENLRESVKDEYLLLDIDQLKAGYITRRDRRSRAT